MKTHDFYTKPSSKNINESMKKKFGEKLDLDSYTVDQLNKTYQLIENKMAGYKNSKFNDTLNSEEYHRLTFMRDAVKTAISERKAKPDFLDLDKDGNKKETMKKAASDAKKKKTVKENMQTMFELAKDLAEKYRDAHTKGNHRKMAFYEKALEECGATISHGPMGECMMSHPHQAGGKPMPVGILSPSGIVSPKGPSPLMTSERRVAEAKKSKPDFLDLDKDGNKKETMKKAAKDKEEKEGNKGMSAKQQKFFGKKKPVKESVDMAIRRYLLEGEEGKAELVMAVKNMVDKFTGWSEDIAKMQAQSAMEMADDIRDELGSDQAEAFTQAIAPALDAAFQAVKAAREALNGQVGSMTGNAPAAMGAEEPGAGMGAEEPGAGMGADMGADMGAEEPGAGMGADIAAAGETPPEGREKRESIERTRRLTRILSGR